jgi:protein ImuB
MYACIFIPDFTVEAVLRFEPMLRGQAVAVLEGKPPLCYVVGANEAARHLGVEVGMTKLLAETLQKATEEPGRQLKNVGEKTKNEEGGSKNDETTQNGEQKRESLLTPHDTEHAKEDRRRAHSQGAYESTYGRMDGRFGLYRTRLEAEELKANDPTENGERGAESHLSKPSVGRRAEKIDRNGTPWSHEAIRQGSFVPTGKSRIDRAPASFSLTLRQRAVAQEESAHAALLDAAHAVSPRVEDSAPDTVVLFVDGLERLFGTPQQVAQELVRRVSEVGLVGNVAIAANPDAAEHAARGFSGVTIVPANREAERLGALPLEILFAAERSAVVRSTKRRDEQRKASDRFDRMQETLDRWGIRNFRGLAALPPVSLSERLGTSGVRLQMLASGTGTRELVMNEPMLRFEETIELEYPVDVLEPLAFLLARMLEGLCGRLAARALSTNELRLRMKLEHRAADESTKSEDELEGEPIVERKLTLPVPMNDARLFLKLLQLELSATPPGAPVTQLWLEAEPAHPRIGQAGLFQPLVPETQKLELTLARMHKLLGVREQLRAGSAELVDTHQSDTFKVQRFNPADEERITKNEGLPEKVERRTENAFGALTLRRFRPPLLAEIDLRDGVPVRLSCPELGARDPLHDNIVWAAGPWRSSGNWWEENGKTEKRKNRKTSPEPSTKNQEPDPDNLREEPRANNEELCWNNQEWDIALALTLRGFSRRERTTQIGLYRLVHSRTAERWMVEGGYD